MSALSHLTCLGCNGPLPAWRGGHCDACVEWNDPPGGVPGIDDNDPGAPPDPDPAPGRAVNWNSGQGGTAKPSDEKSAG